MSYNPHVHFVVAGGALSDDGTRWLPSNVNYLFPVFALSKVLPSGFRKVRHYGLASARSEMDVELLKWLVTITLQMVYVITIGARTAIAKPSAKCHHCGGHLRLYTITFPSIIGYDTS